MRNSAWMLGLFRWPRLLVVCRGSCPSIMVCGFINLCPHRCPAAHRQDFCQNHTRSPPLASSQAADAGSPARRLVPPADLPQGITPHTPRTHVAIEISSAERQPTAHHDLPAHRCRGGKGRHSALRNARSVGAHLKASMTTLPLTDCMGSTTTATARWFSASKLCKRTLPFYLYVLSSR